MCERARCLHLCREDCLAIVRDLWAMFASHPSVSSRAVSRDRLRSLRPEPTMAQRGFALLFSFLRCTHCHRTFLYLLHYRQRTTRPFAFSRAWRTDSRVSRPIVHGQARIPILNTLILQVRSLHFMTVHNTNVLSYNATNGFYLENVSISPIKDGIKEITS